MAIYRRVSTDTQAEDGFSLEAQKNRLLSYIDSQGWSLIEDYADEGFSAKNLERPNLKRLISDLKAGKFDIVLVYRLDRLVRSVSDLHELLSLFEKYKIKFKSATEVFDTTSAMGRLFITIVGAMSQWERENLSERVHFGMKQMVLEGKRAGAKAPFGYDYIDGKLIVNEQEAKWIRFIFENYLTKGQRAIAAELNSMGIRTKSGKQWRGPVVYVVATNPVYAGYIRWNYRKASGYRTHNEVIVEGDHPPIISAHLYEDVQNTIKSRAGKGYKGTVHYPFTGLLKCAQCDSPMIGAKRRRKNDYYRFYRCTGRFNQGICEMPIIGEEIIEQEFLNQLELPEYGSDSKSLENNVDLEQIELQLSKIASRVERLKEMYLDGDISKAEYKSRLESEKNKELALKEELQTSTTFIDMDLLKEFVSNVKENWHYATYEERKKMIHAIIDYIKIDVTERHSGGPGKNSKIKIVDYKMK